MAFTLARANAPKRSRCATSSARATCGLTRKRRGQRPDPVVVPEGPSAGGGVRSTPRGPGVRLGPGLVATWLVLHGPQVRIANTRENVNENDEEDGQQRGALQS